MKRLLIATFLLAMSTHHSNAGLFGNSHDADYEHRVHAEEQITSLQSQINQERQASSRWQTASFGLGIACPILLIIGTVLGASTRKHHAKS